MDIDKDIEQDEIDPRKTARKALLTPKQWAEIEALWEEGDITFVGLQEKYGSSISTFDRHFRRRGVVKGSKREEIKKKMAELLEKTTLDEATVQATRIRETKEEHYKMATALSRLTWREIIAAQNASKPFSNAMANVKALDAAMTVLKKAREERWVVLGLDRPDAIDPDQVPDLVISELTADQVQALRDRDHLETDTSQVHQNDQEDVQFDDELSEGGEA